MFNEGATPIPGSIHHQEKLKRVAVHFATAVDGLPVGGSRRTKLSLLLVVVVAAFALVAWSRPTARELGGWLASLFATFIGAFFAFQFGLRQRKQERLEKEVAAGNIALGSLIEMWERLKQ